MHLLSVGVCFVTTVFPVVLLGAEIQPPYFGKARAVAADKSLLVEPPPEVRTLRSSRSGVFEVPPQLRVWDFKNSRIDAGPLFLAPLRTPHTKKKPNQVSEPTPTSVTPRADARVTPAAVVTHL